MSTGCDIRGNHSSRVAGIVMECNPFHEGHEAILRAAREIAGGGPVVVVMSGDFVQRGEPAIAAKETRVRNVLEGGADVVLELPLFCAVGGADYFARGAVTLLDRLGVVTDLVFGSGCGDTRELQEIAAILAAEPAEYQKALRESLSAGMPYPSARDGALRHITHGMGMPGDANDLLGVEYCRALIRSGSAIVPHAVLRRSEDSASRLRSRIRAKDPSAMSIDVFSSALLYQMKMDLMDGPEALSGYVDVSPELSRRVAEHIREFRTASSFILLLKTKNVTYTHVSRALLHILLRLRGEDLQRLEQAGLIGYARVLGFRRSSSDLVSRIVDSAAIPVITNPGRFLHAQHLSPSSLASLQRDIAASELYDLFRQQAQAPLSARTGTISEQEERPSDTNTRIASAAQTQGPHNTIPETTPELSKPLIVV